MWHLVEELKGQSCGAAFNFMVNWENTKPDLAAEVLYVMPMYYLLLA